VINIKKVVTAITLSRIVGSLSLLLITPLTSLFYAIYTWCVVSDIVDGPIARKTKTTSNFGALLDSVADILLVVVMLIIFIPILALEMWMILMIVAVLGVRAIAFAIGFVKYRTFTMLHTYSNKGSTLLLAFFPILYGWLGLNVTFPILFVAAILSAIEELIITIKSKELKRNITSMFALD